LDECREIVPGVKKLFQGPSLELFSMQQKTEGTVLQNHDRRISLLRSTRFKQIKTLFALMRYCVMKICKNSAVNVRVDILSGYVNIYFWSN